MAECLFCNDSITLTNIMQTCFISILCCCCFLNRWLAFILICISGKTYHTCKYLTHLSCFDSGKKVLQKSRNAKRRKLIILDTVTYLKYLLI